MPPPSSWYKDFMSGYGFDIGNSKPEKRKPGPLPTLGHYRKVHGIQTFTVYCANGVRCWHSAVVTFGDFPDDTVARSLNARMVCTQCGIIGADVRPNWALRELPQTDTPCANSPSQVAWLALKLNSNRTGRPGNAEGPALRYSQEPGFSTFINYALRCRHF